MESPQRVVERLASHGHFAGQRLFADFEIGTSDVEVLGEVVFPVQAQHGLAHQRVVFLAFEADAHVGSSIENALVDDGDGTVTIVNRVVAALCEGDTSCSDHYRMLRNVGTAQVYHASIGGLVFTCQREFVLLGNLASRGLGRVVEGVITIFVSQSFAAQFLSQPVAERLDYREDDAATAGLYGIAFDEVKLAVWVCLLVIVQTVQIHHFQQGCLLEWVFWYVTEAYTCGVAQELDVQFEFLSLHRLSIQAIHVLHHQVPVADAWGVACVLQQLDVQCLVVVLLVGREFTHLIGLSVVGVLVSHCQHLVALERGFQADVAQVLVQGVFR